MSVLEGKLVRACDGTVGRICVVALEQESESFHARFVALIRTEAGELVNVTIEGAKVLDDPPPPYVKPPPTAMPGPGERSR